MKRWGTRKFRFGPSLLAGMLLATAGSSIPVIGNAQVHHGGTHGSDINHYSGHHGSRFGHHGGVHGFGNGHAIVPYDPGIVYRGPLGFEYHRALRHGHSLHREDYAATSDYYSDCRTVYKETHVYGRAAMVSGLMCYDEYGNPYVIPESRRVVDYYE